MAETGAPLGGLDTRHKETAFGPLREPLFRGLWIAAVVCYTGRWMQTVATGWLMTSLTTSPMLVALVQVASSAPAFLLYIPAGAMADMFDRRRVLLFTQAWMVVAAFALGILTVGHWVTPVWLLVLTFFMGIGAVANDPPWQAITHEVVSEQNFASAVALNSAGFNVARAVGPALSGIVIAAWGTATAFFLNAASMFGVVVFLFRWKRRPHEHALPGKDVLVAIKVGFEYAQHSPAVRSVLIRTGAFSLGASGLWALLPLIARPHGSIGFGAMVGFFGLGALLGAALLPAWRRTMSVDAMVAVATLLYAGSTTISGFASGIVIQCTVLLLAGIGWIVIIASLNVCAQVMSPPWLRARVLSMYLLVLQGGMAAGSAIWGAVATHYGIAAALTSAAIVLAIGLGTARWHHLRADRVDLRTTVIEG